MNVLLKKLTWLESWENNKNHNIEVGFDNHKLLKGYADINSFSCLEQLPDINFFIELAKTIPKLYENNNIIEAEIICYIQNKKYRVGYHYDTKYLFITDDSDKIIKELSVQ